MSVQVHRISTPMNVPHLANEASLDHPIWNSLVGDHAHLALGANTGHGLARRYPSNIGPLSAFQFPTADADAYADLAAVVPPGDIAVLFLDFEPRPPAGWELLRGGTLVQMVCRSAPAELALSEEIIPLATSDFPEMVALATLTEPGPFRADTAQLGGFLGIRVDGRIAAMAGRRTSPAGFAEISAVCTHPDFRGRGYAVALVAAVARSIHAAGRIPFLTSFEANSGAIRVYRQVGFAARRKFYLAVLKPPVPE